MSREDKITVKYQTQKEFCRCCDRELEDVEVSEMREFDFYMKQLKEDINWKLYDEECELDEVIRDYVYEKYLEMESGSVDISVEDYEMALEKITIDSELVKVTCNKCGDKNIEEEYDYERFSEISLSFGYGSMYDSEHWSFDLCGNCLTDLVRTFKHVPDGFGEDNHYATYPQAMFEHWKETGEVDLEIGMTSEEIETRGGSIYQDIEEEDTI